MLLPYKYVKTNLQIYRLSARLKFANAHVLGKLNYMLTILSSLNKSQINKVHKLIMFSARSVIGSYCYKMSIKNILSKVNWMSASQLIIWSGLTFLHKIISTKKPTGLFNHYKINKRRWAQIVPHIYPKSTFSKNICINKSLGLF